MVKFYENWIKQYRLLHWKTECRRRLEWLEILTMLWQKIQFVAMMYSDECEYLSKELKWCCEFHSHQG